MGLFARSAVLSTVLLALAVSTNAFLTAPTAAIDALKQDDARAYAHNFANNIEQDVPATHLPQQRKSLAFGPHHHHRKFVTDAAQVKVSSGASSFAQPSTETASIHRAAIDLAKSLVGENKGSSFYVRDDSYLDRQSGLYYAYVKQTINGLVVEDGDLNVVFSSEGE